VGEPHPPRSLNISESAYEVIVIVRNNYTIVYSYLLTILIDYILIAYIFIPINILF
jgi:hypothetical protein